MVDITDLPDAVALNNELAQIEIALRTFDEGGQIIDMSVGFDRAINARVPTWYMEPPPQMVEAIKQFFIQREEQIQSQLAGLGITGIEPQPRR